MYGFVMRNSKDFKRPSTYIIISFFLDRSLVQPCLESATIIKNPYYAKSIKIVQRDFFRAILRNTTYLRIANC